MSEKALAGRVIELLKDLDAVRIENLCAPGTPDINYTGGWIELKQVDSWPKKFTTRLRLPHFTQEQRIWLERRSLKGGLTWVLLQVGHDYLLFEGYVAASILGKATKEQLMKAAYRTWTSKAMKEELLECLQQKN